MAFFTLASARAFLIAELPSGIGGANQTAYLNQAIMDAVAYAGTFLRDTQRVDFVGDSITRRFALSGANCRLAPEEYQETPTGMGSAIFAPPATPPTPSVSGSGSTIPAGLYYLSYAYQTVDGWTVDSPPAAIQVATNGQSIVTGAVPFPTNAENVGWYLSSVGMSTDVQLIERVGAGVSQTFSALPLATAARPLRNYTSLWSYQPQPVLEQDIAVDGSAAVDTATLTLATAPPLHARFRVVYDRSPPIPASDSDVIYVPEDNFRLLALMFAHRTLAYVHEAGDTTQHLDAYAKLEVLVQDMMKQASPRPRSRPRMPDPTS